MHISAPSYKEQRFHSLSYSSSILIMVVDLSAASIGMTTSCNLLTFMDVCSNSVSMKDQHTHSRLFSTW